jgi:hypothetical protein
MLTDDARIFAGRHTQIVLSEEDLNLLERELRVQDFLRTSVRATELDRN